MEARLKSRRWRQNKGQHEEDKVGAQKAGSKTGRSRWLGVKELEASDAEEADSWGRQKSRWGDTEGAEARRRTQEV